MRCFMAFSSKASSKTENRGLWPVSVPAAALGIASLVWLLGGCATEADFLKQNSNAALTAVQARGQFELNCPDVQTQVLSQKVVEGIQTYGWRAARFGAGAGPWAEYTVGASGCGREAVYMAVCRDTTNCNAFSQTANVLEVPK